MRGRRLGELLRRAPVPEEREAEERSWDVIREAYEEREPTPGRRRLPRLWIALGGGLAVLGVALSPAGAEVGDLVERVVDSGQEEARPALSALPSAGELLVESEQGAWIVREDGSRRLLGDYDEATWSPQGLFVAVTRDRSLSAVEPDGDVRWSLSRPDPVSDPRWSPSPGFRVAYRSGDQLRVVAGDGTGDRLLADGIAPIAPAWRPSAEAKLGPGPGSPAANVLSYVAARGTVLTVNADTGGVLERVPTDETDRVRSLDWSGDGRELLVLGEKSVNVHGPRVSIYEHAGTAVNEDGALSPDGSSVAFISSAPRRGDRPPQSLVKVLGQDRSSRPETLFSGPGRFTDLEWSPDGHWLLVAWHDADQWLFINPDRPRRVVAVDGISQEFAPGAANPSFPGTAGWVLPRR